MPAILHILTRTEDSLAEEIIRRQKNRPFITIRIVDLAAPRPDYDDLVEKIFAADSVAVW